MSDYVLKIGETEYRATVKELTPETARVVVNDTEYEVELVEIGRRQRPEPEVAKPRPTVMPAPASPVATPRTSAEVAGPGGVAAPLPGLILQIKVAEGDSVQAGQPVVIMEAMKMENAVPASHNGTVRKIYVSEGDSVGEGDVLLEIARPEMTTL
jgi:biotin carboxyl carrier protein